MPEARSVKHRAVGSPIALPDYVRLLENSHELAAAIAPEVLIIVWRCPLTVELIERVDRYTQQARDAHGHYHVLSVIEPDGSGPANAETRQAMAELTQKHESTCHGVVLVVEGTSIKQTLIRMTIVTIQLVATPRVPQPVFDSVDAASAWIGQQRPSVRPDELTRAVQAVRAQRVK